MSRTNTKMQIVAAAETLFAQQGFAATSVSEIAAAVGVSSPAIYKHFRNKLAIYEAVCESLFTPLADATKDLNAAADFSETRQQLQQVLALLADNPNAARLVQHATLAKDETLALIGDKWYRRFFAFASGAANDPSVEWLSPSTVMAFHCMILGYVTLAPLHESIFHTDPLSSENREAQMRFQQDLVNGLNALHQANKLSSKSPPN